MYERYWGLNGSPFQGTCDPRGYVETAVHEEALGRLMFLVEQRRHFGLLRGPVGSGKSLLLSVAQREAERLGREVALVDLFGLDAHEMLWQLAVAWRLGPTEHCSRSWLWQTITDHLEALHVARIPTVLVCDHLDQAESDCLFLLERLLHLPVARTNCLTILAAAHDHFDEQLFPELLEQSDLRIELPYLTRSESAAFVRGLLRAAGCHRELWNAGALDTLHNVSGGEPRAILRLCDLALAAGAHQESREIDSNSVRAVAEELPRRSRREFSLTGIG